MSFKRFLKSVTGKDDAVYWPPIPGPQDNYGQYTNASPKGFKCRWEDRIIDFVDREGKIIQTKAVIYVYQIWQNLNLQFGGIVWHGKLAAASFDYRDTPGALEIRGLNSDYDLENTVTLTRVYLS